jgi:hypothetical protein
VSPARLTALRGDRRWPATHEEFTSFFAGTEIVPPGIAEARRWIAGLTASPPDHGLYVRCGAGVKS